MLVIKLAHTEVYFQPVLNNILFSFNSYTIKCFHVKLAVSNKVCKICVNTDTYFFSRILRDKSCFAEMLAAFPFRLTPPSAGTPHGVHFLYTFRLSNVAFLHMHLMFHFYFLREHLSIRL